MLPQNYEDLIVDIIGGKPKKKRTRKRGRRKGSRGRHRGGRTKASNKMDIKELALMAVGVLGAAYVVRYIKTNYATIDPNMANAAPLALGFALPMVMKGKIPAMLIPVLKGVAIGGAVALAGSFLLKGDSSTTPILSIGAGYRDTSRMVALPAYHRPDQTNRIY